MKDFYIEKKIYYHDTDCGGVVYYANYLKYLEEGRTEYCVSKGIDLKGQVEKGTYFVVVHTEIDYKAPARYQDALRVYAGVEKIGNSTVHFWQKITKDSVTVVEAKTTWVCVGRDFNPKPVPGEVKRLLLSHSS